MLPDEQILLVLSAYRSLLFKIPTGVFTVLASFSLTSGSATKVISLGTGSKVLPKSRLPLHGDALHDCHAEIVARRGAVVWFLDEVKRCHQHDDYTSDWIELQSSTSLYALRPGVCLNFYVSTLPCGDASTRYLSTLQDEQMATLKDSVTSRPIVDKTGTARGRDNYGLYGVLRTKPGRADSPLTTSMSCSDKIASWSVLGIQGALASHFLAPLYIANMIIGEVDAEMHDIVRADCERAFCGRLQGVDSLPTLFRLNIPKIHFTSQIFSQSRSALQADTSTVLTSHNETICWVADSAKKYEVLINGMRRGAPPQRRHDEKYRPQLCKMSFFERYSQLLGYLPDRQQTYHEAKQGAVDYQKAKDCLCGPAAPFAGWLRSGAEWESFLQNGELKKI